MVQSFMIVNWFCRFVSIETKTDRLSCLAITQMNFFIIPIIYLLSIVLFFLFSNIRMPPKKKDEATGPPPLIGRMGVNLKIGIVGLPNVG